MVIAHSFIIPIAMTALALATLSACYDNWEVMFYTGRKVFSGSNAEAYIQLIGEQGNSSQISLSNDMRKSAGSVTRNRFGVNTNVGTVRQLVVGVYPSNLPTSDWYLEKVELIDPDSSSYLFLCNCWLNIATPQMTLNVYQRSQSGGTFYRYNESRYSFTLGMLSLLTFVIIFTYMVNVVCKKWRNRIRWYQYERRNMRFRRGGSDEPAATAPGLINTPAAPQQTESSLSSDLKVDKPPAYKDLFPSRCETNDETANNK